MSRRLSPLLLCGPALCGLTFLGGCERLNPTWCDRAGRCAAGQICDPGTNSCITLDATPDILSHVDYPWPDGPVDGGQGEVPADGAPERGATHDFSSEHPDLPPPADFGTADFVTEVDASL